MRDLSQLQKNFQEYLMLQQKNIQDEIISTSKVPATIRLDIYRDAYYLRLLDALKQDYAVLETILGTEQFDEFGRNYIDAYPSHFRSIRWFGKNVAKFMQDSKAFSDYPWLIEIANFEWLLTEAFDAEDSPVVTIAEMATIPFDQWPTMNFVLHPSFQRLNLHWNIIPMWTEIKENETYIEPVHSEVPISWMIWRREYDIQFCSLAVDEAYAIDAMSAGKNFSEICAGLCEWIDEQNVAIHAATLLKRFITDALITEIQFSV